MEISGLFLLFFVLLSRDAFGRNTAGQSEEAVETLSSAGEVLTPWEPRPWLPERRKRTLFSQGSSFAQTQGEGYRVPVFPQAPLPVPAPVPDAPAPPTHFYITRLVPVFTSSQFVGASGGVNGLYLPPTTEPPIFTGGSGGSGGFGGGSRLFHDCINECEYRNDFGDCDLNVTCLFSQTG